MVQVKATELRSIRKEEDRKVEAGRHMREERSDQMRPDLGPREEWGCSEWATWSCERNLKNKVKPCLSSRQKKKPGNGPENL